MQVARALEGRRVVLVVGFERAGGDEEEMERMKMVSSRRRMRE